MGLLMLGLNFQIIDDLFLDPYRKKYSGLGYVFNGHLYCIESFAWSLPTAASVHLSACYCL